MVSQDFWFTELVIHLFRVPLVFSHPLISENHQLWNCSVQCLDYCTKFAYCSICGAIDPTVTFKSAGFKTSPAIPPECLRGRVYIRSGSFGNIRRMRISEALNSRIYTNMFIFGSKYIQVYLRRREKVAHLWQQWPAVRTLKALIKMLVLHKFVNSRPKGICLVSEYART